MLDFVVDNIADEIILNDLRGLVLRVAAIHAATLRHNDKVVKYIP